MTETPVARLVSTLAVPTIISMLVSSLYNMADTYFVSQLGTSAAGAVGVDVTATEQAEIVTYATSAITGVSGLVIIGRNLYTKYKARTS